MKLTTTAALQINQILRQGGLVLISILLAKSGLTTHDIGIFESLLFIGTTVTFFWMNALLQGTLSEYAHANTLEKPKVKFNIVLIFNVLSVIIFAFLFFLKPYILLALTGKNELPYFEFYCFYILLNLPPIVLESLWTVEDTPLSILAYSIVSHLFLPIAVAMPIWLGYGLGDSIVAMIVVAIIRYIWLIINVLKNNYFTVDFEIIRSFLKLCLPLMGYSLVGGFIGAFSSWIINWYYQGNMHTFALFRYGAREFPLSLALMTGLSNSIIPLLTPSKGIENQGFTILKEKSLRLWHWLFPVSILLMLTSKELFKAVFNPEFAESATIFNIYLLLLIPRALFPQSILLAFKETKMIFWISIIETFAIVALSFILIFPFGTEGVAYATLAGYLLEKALNMAFLKRKYGINWESYTEVRWFLGYSILLILTYFFVITANSIIR